MDSGEAVNCRAEFSKGEGGRGVGFALAETGEDEVSKISGSPFCAPMTTTFALDDLARSSVASIPFHRR